MNPPNTTSDEKPDKPVDELIVLDRMLSESYTRGYRDGWEAGVQAALAKAD